MGGCSKQVGTCENSHFHLFLTPGSTSSPCSSTKGRQHVIGLFVCLLAVRRPQFKVSFSNFVWWPQVKVTATVKISRNFLLPTIFMHSLQTLYQYTKYQGWLSIWSSLLGSKVKADLEKNKTWSNILYEKTQRRHNRLVALCGNTNIKVLMQRLAFGGRCELWMLSCNSSFTSIQVKSADSDEMTLKAYLTQWESISFKIKEKT